MLVWEGPVLVFESDTGERCYGFTVYSSGGRPQIRAVLRTAQVDSPEKAVRAALALRRDEDARDV